MTTDGSAAMDDAAVTAFVGQGGTGVLALAAEDRPYATPVSYGFEPAAKTFYLRLGFRDGSEKRAFLERSAEARFVIYDRDATGWTPDIATTLRDAELPLFDLWDEPTESLRFQIYRLDVESLTGRTTINRE